MCPFVVGVSSVQELISVYVSVLRRVTVCVGVCVLLCVCVRYRDPLQQNLQVLQDLREMQRNLREALQHAGDFSFFQYSQFDHSSTLWTLMELQHKTTALSADWSPLFKAHILPAPPPIKCWRMEGGF